MQKNRKTVYRPLKGRIFKSRRSSVNSSKFWARIHWAKAGLMSFGCGSLAINLINRLLSHSKKVLRWPRRMSRVWVNIPRRHTLTKKAINTRMGKGKGSRAGVCARLKGGSLLAAYADIRRAQIIRLQRWLRVRVPFKVTYYNSNLVFGVAKRPAWVRLWRLQPKYINNLIDRLDIQLTEIHRPGLFIYYMGVLTWRWQAPKGGFRKVLSIRANRSARRARRKAIRHALKRKAWSNLSRQNKLAVLRLGREFSRRLAWTVITKRRATFNNLLMDKPEDLMFNFS